MSKGKFPELEILLTRPGISLSENLQAGKENKPDSPHEPTSSWMPTGSSCWLGQDRGWEEAVRPNQGVLCAQH